MPKPALTMASEWRSFEQMLLKNAPPIQKQEMRRAFYAGAQAYQRIMMLGLDPGTEPTDADMDRMTALNDELEQFVKDVVAGNA